jgi:hypothetical protein
MSSCLLYNSWGALAPPPYPKLSHDRVTSTQRKLEQKYLLFLRVENPKEQEIPHCGGYARPQGLGCLRSNACGLALPACRPPQSKSTKVLDKETNESSLCLFSEAACGLDINSLSISMSPPLGVTFNFRLNHPNPSAGIDRQATGPTTPY